MHHRLSDSVVARLATCVAGAGLLVAGFAAPAGAAPTWPIKATVTTVLVNKTGGVTAAGKMDCAQAVQSFDWGPGGIPANLSVVAHVEWSAFQPVGRKTMLQASYSQQGFQWSCYNTNADGQHGPVCGGSAAPCPWLSSRDPSTNAAWFVYAPNGKFAPGPVHVELSVTGFTGNVLIDGAQQPLDLDVSRLPIAFDLKARKA
jgi:hypothetical protein